MAVGERIAEERASRAAPLKEIEQGCWTLLEGLASVAESWTGSNIGHHAHLYFKDFERPSLAERFDPEWGTVHGLREGWQERSLKEIEERVEQGAGKTIDGIHNAADDQMEACRSIQSELSIVAAPLSGLVGFDKEKALVEQLEQHEWGAAPTIRLPGGMTRDSQALAEGVQAAPHQLAYRRVQHARSRGQACTEFLALAERATRQIVSAVGAAPPQAAPPVAATGEDRLQELLALLRRFPQFAMQLERPQRERAALTIGDEYDVQHLVKSILLLFTDDVRAEEWTPSWAGASARMDFLLKRERIAVEIKKTRGGLGPRKLGEELSTDGAHYKGHSDVDVLVCFVYDPENVVTNPRGFEDDVTSLTSESLRVVAIVA